MGKTSRDLAGNTAFGFIVGFLTRKGYDAFNQKVMVRKHNNTGEIPKKKSMFLSIVLALLFGGFGLFYISPRNAILLTFWELIMFLFSVGVYNLLFRPVILLLAFSATLSHNKMALYLFNRFGGDGK
ncbi:hypothetical protein WMZ97_16680 [Lentibacillus sp. N15]|uniref:hypothetical protein n=1 Tax=Lentibacillus songyuanensis TaxID=3136161 RepID=UPI0031BA3FDF